jgi:hypothetical protein
MLRRRLRRSLDRARTFLGLRPLERPPLGDDERSPVEGRGRVRDPGHVPESMRAPCGRPPPGERPIPENFEARDAIPDRKLEPARSSEREEDPP